MNSSSSTGSVPLATVNGFKLSEKNAAGACGEIDLTTTTTNVSQKFRWEVGDAQTWSVVEPAGTTEVIDASGDAGHIDFQAAYDNGNGGLTATVGYFTNTAGHCVIVGTAAPF